MFMCLWFHHLVREQVMLNPFHTPTQRITSKDFDRKVKVLAKRILG